MRQLRLLHLQQEVQEKNECKCSTYVGIGEDAKTLFLNWFLIHQ